MTCQVRDSPEALGRVDAEAAYEAREKEGEGEKEGEEEKEAVVGTEKEAAAAEAAVVAGDGKTMLQRLTQNVLSSAEHMVHSH